MKKQSNLNTTNHSNGVEGVKIMSQLAFGVMCIILCTLLLSSQRIEAMQLVEQADQSALRASGGSFPAATLTIVENPELTVRVLENLIRSIVYSASDYQSTSGAAQKRGLDLGISRGFSGSQAGKHLMGLSAASFANGPGR